MTSIPSRSTARRLSSLFSSSQTDGADGASGQQPPAQETASGAPSAAPSRNTSGSGASSRLKKSLSSQLLTSWSSSEVVQTPAAIDYPPSTLALPPEGLSATPQAGRPESRAASRASSPAPAGIDASFLAGLAPSDSRSKRRSWIPSRSRNVSQDFPAAVSVAKAWVAGPLGDRTGYEISNLELGRKVPELWNDAADTFVYLFPRNSGRGPSFKVDSALFLSSAPLTFLANGGVYSGLGRESLETGRGRQPAVEGPSGYRSGSSSVSSHSVERGRRSGSNSVPKTFFLDVPESPPTTPEISTQEELQRDSPGVRNGSESAPEPLNITPIEHHLYFPLPTFDKHHHASAASPSNPTPAADDTEILLTVRNLFAFLSRKPLVSTAQTPTTFAIFMGIAALLRQNGFSNHDGSTLGETAVESFSYYIQEFALADFRQSHEKIVEGIVLGESMRSMELYNEAFVHFVGKHKEILEIKSPLYLRISPVTRNRIERAALDLDQRILSVRVRLTDFDFPSIFEGIAISSADKAIHFKQWRSSYLSFRKHVLSYYKHQYGAWPPKARSKKNDFEENGLNRLLLLDLYQDMADVYDLLVDRDSLTPRTTDTILSFVANVDPQESSRQALRSILSEYDHSVPPFQPPVPYDTPRLPSASHIYGDSVHNFGGMRKRLYEHELERCIKGSVNNDAIKQTPFLEAFRTFEKRAAQGKSLQEVCDQRYGHWIFLYAVIQTLPMLVVDAPGIRWTKGVEYFLCEPPKGGIPWCREDHTRKKSWYAIAGSAGVVNLPPDIVEHGVEGVYRRSHCWRRAQQWDEERGLLPPPDPPESPVAALSPTLSLPESPPLSGRARSRSFAALGLQRLPVPANTALAPSRDYGRPLSQHDPMKSFENILGAQNQGVLLAAPAKKKNRISIANFI
ncbi:MAG: hypothetical protein M1829_005334 [Trizodia sp. TS-e1964]|nr:MAG: hypothetical protein M1829_005334 [Trizodia sp. TS-e1964]